MTVEERRETERAITDWEEERRRLGRELALMTLNASDMVREKWSHRFIIAVDRTVEYCSLLFYGAKFAALMGLPEKPNHSIPMVEQLPSRYLPVFTKGCIDAMLLAAHADTGRGRSRSGLAQNDPLSLRNGRRVGGDVGT